MKKTAKVVASIILILTLSTSLSASSLIRNIAGKENKGIKITYNNQVQNLKDGHGNDVYPVIINGSTYLPVRAIADMMGADITWDGQTKTISIMANDSVEDGAVPTDLPSANNKNDSSNQNSPTQNQPKQDQSTQKNVSTNSGSIDNPVELGTTISYSDKYDIDNWTKCADYELTVSNVEPITREKISSLGFKPNDDTSIDYVMVTLKVDVSNATYEGTRDYAFLISYLPDIWGTEAKNGNCIIGGTHYGFDGSLKRNLEELISYKELHPGQKESFSVEGKIILGVYKNTENYLSIQKYVSMEKKDRIFFKLK
ncbi:copper amine oxidase N-terminal domain-containing protein [Vallitalea guaymasensis]|uniref:copper amine oxidase N-terminal domain-containing protein n=1 Tax=Vallitalea guaymasensis TaxID=1185412 RepID=UPI00272C580B|nr:copper amine oxidase N-terminal domain-containing protein [Vallitalea guaymasensis]